MLDINSLKSGQMLRYSVKLYSTQERVESLWILLEEMPGAEYFAAQGARAFKMYQIYDSHNALRRFGQNRPVEFVFNLKSIQDFALEVV